MIVECPACHTRYRVNHPEAITATSIFQCSQEECNQEFSLSLETFQGQNRVSATPVEDFASDRDLFPAPPESPSRSDSSRQPPIAASFSTSRQTVNDFDEEDDFTALTEENVPARSFASLSPSITSATTTESKFPPFTDADMDTPAETAFSIWPLLTLLGFLVLLYLGVSYYCRNHVAATEAMLARLPIIGAPFSASQFSVQNLKLSDLKSSLWLTKDNKRVFAVAGKVTNIAPVPASKLEIVGEIYDQTGEIVGRQKIFGGTETVPEVLPNLTIREIEILLKLAPPKQFNIPPGQGINFLLVFFHPPSQVAELSCWVEDVQFGGS